MLYGVRNRTTLVLLAASAFFVGSAAAANPEPFRAAAVRAAFAQAGMASYMAQSSGSRTRPGAREGDATITSHLAPACPLPNGFFSATLASPALEALEGVRPLLIFTGCHRDWVAVVFFRTAAGATGERRHQLRALARSHLAAESDRNLVVIHPPTSASEAAAALRNLH